MVEHVTRIDDDCAPDWPTSTAPGGIHRVRITGQLIDATTAAHLWADRFEGTLDDIFELQDQVASSVAGACTDASRPPWIICCIWTKNSTSRMPPRPRLRS